MQRKITKASVIIADSRSRFELPTAEVTFLEHEIGTHFLSQIKIYYSKCHVTSNKANSNLQCAEEKFQTRGWVQRCEKWKAASYL
jgi:hypothetical protein